MGLAIGRDGMLYAANSSGAPGEWMTKGGGIFRFSRSLDFFERLTEDYPAINGIACDSSGNIYFATSNFSFLNPEGWIYKLVSEPGKPLAVPEVFIHDSGISNGLYYDKNQDKIYYSNTIVGVYDFTPGQPELNEVYLKLRFMEACDDLCTDISGNVWMTDPGYSTVKMFNPGTGRLARFNIKGVGQTSSCRIRTEKGVEMLYITELKSAQKPMSRDYDGRGVLVVPTSSLIRLLEPVLLHNP
jgi:sugar lactone lactonase YvrE